MSKAPRFLLVVCMTAIGAAAERPRVSVTFASQNGEQKFDAAADEYRRIWVDEGNLINRK